MNGQHSFIGRHTMEENVIILGIGSSAEPRLLDGMSHSARQIAGLVMTGRSNAEIAKLRGTSPRTVANQVAALFETLGVGSRAQLVRRLARGH